MIIEYITFKGKKYHLREWVTLTIMLMSSIGSSFAIYYFVKAMILFFVEY